MADDFLDIRLRDLEFFDRLSRAGSITAAADELGLPKATASRWLAQLEARVGVSLAKRTTRSISLTEAGDTFAIRAGRLLSAAHAARAAVHEELVGGTLRVSVPVPMGRMLSGPVIARFREKLPAVKLEIRLQNERVDLVDQGIDVAIRGGPLPDSEFIARRLSSAAMWLYRSRRYADTPLDEVPLVGSRGDDMLLRRSDLAVSPALAVVVDDRTAVADALAFGAGMGLLPSFLGEPYRDEGRLDRVAKEPVVTMPIHALYHASQRGDPRIDVLVAEVEEQLRQLL